VQQATFVVNLTVSPHLLRCSHKAELYSARRTHTAFKNETDQTIEELRDDIARKQQEFEDAVIEHEEEKHRLMGLNVKEKLVDSVQQTHLKEEIKEEKHKHIATKMKDGGTVEHLHNKLSEYENMIDTLKSKLVEKGEDMDGLQVSERAISRASERIQGVRSFCSTNSIATFHPPPTSASFPLLRNKPTRCSWNSKRRRRKTKRFRATSRASSRK